jgi:hypothetical protein
LTAAKYGRVNQRRDRDGQPILRRHIPSGHRPTRLQRTAALSPQARSQWAFLRVAESSLALIGRILQHRPGQTALPHVASAGSLTSSVQSATHLADAGSLQPDPVEHLADDTSLIKHDLVAGRTTTFFLTNVAIALTARRITPPRCPGVPRGACHGDSARGSWPVHTQGV